MYKDYMFEILEGFNEGEEILCEALSYNDAINTLIYNYGFKREELKYLGAISIEEGEMLGLDTY